MTRWELPGRPPAGDPQGAGSGSLTPGPAPVSSVLGLGLWPVLVYVLALVRSRR